MKKVGVKIANQHYILRRGVHGPGRYFQARGANGSKTGRNLFSKSERAEILFSKFRFYANLLLNLVIFYIFKVKNVKIFPASQEIRWKDSALKELNAQIFVRGKLLL